jgi:integrase
VLTVTEGIARVHGAAPNKKAALLRDPLLELIDRIDIATTVGLRDRALLLLVFAVGLRRSELVALTVEDLPPPRTAYGSGSPAQDRPTRPRPGTARRLRPTITAMPGSERYARGWITPRSPAARSSAG